MTTDRQRQANQRNAKKSTGPRSEGGKTRASRNSLRHGFAAQPTSTFKSEIDRLAEQILDKSDDTMMLASAREIADAELTITRVRRAKAVIIDRISTLKDRDSPSGTRRQSVE